VRALAADRESIRSTSCTPYHQESPAPHACNFVILAIVLVVMEYRLRTGAVTDQEVIACLVPKLIGKSLGLLRAIAPILRVI
jgi:hypothetical protein